MSKGAFSREACGAIPELSAIFDRYLSEASWEQTVEGYLVYVPTTFQARGLQRFQASLEKALHGPLAGIRANPVSVTTAAPTAPQAPTLPLALSSVPVSRTSSTPPTASGTGRQFPLNLPPRLNVIDPIEAERTRRQPVPHLVRSPGNEMSVQLLKNWAEHMNPGASTVGRPPQVVWVHGPSGSGKTHLLRQLNDWVSCGRRLVNTNVMNFFREWREALERHDTMPFVRKYRRETDVLVLENLDELQGKVKTQEEVLFTVNALLERGACVAVSSSLHPLQMKEVLGEALFSRLFSGLAIQMTAPDRPFREQLWRRLLETHGLGNTSVELVVQERLLNLPVDTARKAHTVFINAIGRLSLQRFLTIEDVGALENLYGPRVGVANSGSHSGQTPREMAEAVARLCGTTMAAIQGKVRRQDICMARRFVFLALSKLMGLTNGSIADLLEKDASTVSHGLKTLLAEIEKDRHVANQWNWVCSRLGMPPGVGA
jgi:chromosomal replication initiation ATPase DnaA